MISIKYPIAGCALAAMLGATAAAGLAHAQPMGGQSGGPSGAPGQGGGGQGGGGQGGQGGQQQLHDALRLNPHQEQAWHVYQAGLRPSPDQAQQLRAMSQMSMASMSTPQRLDMIDQGMSLQVQSFHRTADVTRAFYATLNPDQQRTFDQITAPPSRGGQGPR